MIGTMLVGTIGNTWAIFHALCALALAAETFKAISAGPRVGVSVNSLISCVTTNAAAAFAIASLTRWATGL
jgi:hypothetical protein